MPGVPCSGLHFEASCCVTMGAVSSGCLLSGAVAVLGIAKKPDAEFGYHADTHM